MANPELKGLTSMQIFDKTVDSLTKFGVAVILNNHISDAGWCCNDFDENGLWHNNHYSTQQWIGALSGMTLRYKQNKFVIGNDLRNEIRNDIWRLLFPGWGNGNPNTDWKLAATQAGNEVLK